MADEIDPQIRMAIDRRLDEIERDHDVRILLAVESGSRAWGFPSPDSDYDARFIYAHKPEWYVSLQKGRDVIELPIENDLDINGWEITKALNLLCKPNPVMLEWIESPIVYRQTDWVVERMRALADLSLHRHAGKYHYLHLAQGQYRRFIDGRERVSLKKYFYSLRPALALYWMRTQDAGRVPMSLPALLAGVALPKEVQSFIADLVAQKKHSKELGDGPRIAALDGFIEAEIAAAEAGAARAPEATEALLAGANKLLREIVLGT